MPHVFFGKPYAVATEYPTMNLLALACISDYSMPMLRTPEKKIAILVAAHNAAQDIQRTLEEIPSDIPADILVVDDCSYDGTGKLCHDLGIRTVIHAEAMGWGAVQKTLFHEALKFDYDILIMIGAQQHYDPRDIHHLIQPLLDNQAEVVLGNRELTQDPRTLGMPGITYMTGRWIRSFSNALLGLRLRTYQTSMRAYNARVLRQIPFKENSNSFLFDVELIYQLAVQRVRIQEVPVTLRGYTTTYPFQFKNLFQYAWQGLRLLSSYILHSNNLLPSSRYRVLPLPEPEKYPTTHPDTNSQDNPI